MIAWRVEVFHRLVAKQNGREGDNRIPLLGDAVRCRRADGGAPGHSANGGKKSTGLVGRSTQCDSAKKAALCPRSVRYETTLRGEHSNMTAAPNVFAEGFLLLRVISLTAQTGGSIVMKAIIQATLVISHAEIPTFARTMPHRSSGPPAELTNQKQANYIQSDTEEGAPAMNDPPELKHTHLHRISGM